MTSHTPDPVDPDSPMPKSPRPEPLGPDSLEADSLEAELGATLGPDSLGAELGPGEMALWHAWKAAADAVLARVAAEVTAETGLSGPDFAVLTRVAELGEGRLRQNRLAASTGFHRSRLSHHLARMEERALITREPADGGVDVLITEAGRAAGGKARPVHAAAVRRHLLSPLAGLDQGGFQAALDRLYDAGA